MNQLAFIEMFNGIVLLMDVILYVFVIGLYLKKNKSQEVK